MGSGITRTTCVALVEAVDITKPDRSDPKLPHPEPAQPDNLVLQSHFFSFSRDLRSLPRRHTSIKASTDYTGHIWNFSIASPGC